MAGTVLGVGLTVEGELTSEEEVAVYGSLRGTLTTSDAVIVGPQGSVESDIEASSVAIAGQLIGDVNASERVDIQPGGRLIGNVKASRLTIADGASFKGNVDMDV